MFLKQNPFIRLLVPFMAGILIHEYLSLIYTLIAITFLLLLTFLFLRFNHFPKSNYLIRKSILFYTALLLTGITVGFLKDVKHQPNKPEKLLPGEMMVMRLEEPLVEKENTYKAEAAVVSIMTAGGKRSAAGRGIIYFRKDTINNQLKAGDQILTNQPLQEITSTQNLYGFDYKTYCLRQGLSFQVYLTSAHCQLISRNQLSFFRTWLFEVREFVLSCIKTYIKGKKEQGLAEAMLIGYKGDLDKHLLRSYTNTGVVHVIAVSGMHLALLYWMIRFLLKPLQREGETRWLHTVLVLGILWGFSLLTGAAASIVRAAVMFTFITIGKQFNHNASVYNILAASAFCQLCYHPYWLWDLGFQLSYAAVFSIVIFYKPIHHLLHIKNKLLHSIWQLATVSIAAQILTTPLVMYYFHQFPVYFLISNLVVVPVSTVVLMGTLLLVIASPLKFLAALIGHILNSLIWWLNTFIEAMEAFPFALWEGIQINVLQTLLLFIVIAGIGFWLMRKCKNGLWTAMISLMLFFAIRSYSFYQAEQQRRLIVYHVPRHMAIDFISGRKYIRLTETDLSTNHTLHDYVFKPSQTAQRVTKSDRLPAFYKFGNSIWFHDKKILILNTTPKFQSATVPLYADVVILCGSPRLFITDLIKTVHAQQIVIDGSVPAWKAGYWQKDCDSLKIACHNTAAQGAFVMNVY